VGGEGGQGDHFTSAVKKEVPSNRHLNPMKKTMVVYLFKSGMDDCAGRAEKHGEKKKRDRKFGGTRGGAERVLFTSRQNPGGRARQKRKNVQRGVRGQTVALKKKLAGHLYLLGATPSAGAPPPLEGKEKMTGEKKKKGAEHCPGS